MDFSRGYARTTGEALGCGPGRFALDFSLALEKWGSDLFGLHGDEMSG